MINAIQIALSGLSAASKKVEASASNVANMLTAGSLDDPENAPYAPIKTQQEALTDADGNSLGVKAGFVPKTPAFIPSYAPDSPFANGDGLIGVPNVDLAEEAVNMSLAKTAFSAAAKTIQTASAMQEDLLRMFDERA